MSASAPRAEMSKALAAFASTMDPSAPAVRGRVFSSALPDPAVAKPALAPRLGMNLSAALCGSLIVVLPALDLSTVSFLDFSLEGVPDVLGPVPVNVQSETPRSNPFGDCLDLAMFDFGELAYVNLETDLEIDREKKVEGSDLWMDCSFRNGVEGDEVADTFDKLVVLWLGDGVRGILPPAVLVEKRP